MKHSGTNHEQRHAGRMRDEGEHGKHMRPDGGVPIMGTMGRKIHGAHTGEMAAGKTGMVTDAGNDTHIGGKRGDHQEER